MAESGTIGEKLWFVSRTRRVDVGLLDVLGSLLGGMGKARKERQAQKALEWGDYDEAIYLFEKAGLLRRAAECALKRMEAEGPDWSAPAVEVCHRARFGAGVRQALLFDLQHKRSSWCFAVEHVRLLERYGELMDFVEQVETIVRSSPATVAHLRMHVAKALAEAGEKYDAIGLFVAAARMGEDCSQECYGKALALSFAVGDAKLMQECGAALLRGRELDPMEVAKLHCLEVLRPVVEEVLPAHPERIQGMLYWFLEHVDPKYTNVQFSEAEQEELGGVSDDFEAYEDVMDLLVTVHRADPDKSQYPTHPRRVDLLYDRIWRQDKARRVRRLFDIGEEDRT